MPKPDGSPDDVIDDAATPIGGSAPTLDQVHAISQAKVDDEDETTAETEEVETPAADEDTETPSGDEEVEEVETPAADEEEPVVPVVPEPVTPSAPVAGEADTDITKSGANKIAIRDSEGNKFYFNNLDEVPDTFEPLSYKELMVGTTALLAKKQSDDKTAADAKIATETAAAETAHREATDALQKSWEDDASTLVRSGLLPNEPKKLEAAKEEVYSYIESEMKKGNIITSFNQAYKSMNYDKQQAENVKKQKELDDAKKKRGAIVQPGSGGASSGTPSTRSRVIEAPPTGVGLDAVHARALNNL